MSWLKELVDPKARVEAHRIAGLKRDGASLAEIDRQRPEIRRQLAAMDPAELKRQAREAKSEAGDREKLVWTRVQYLQKQGMKGLASLAPAEAFRREIAAMSIADVRRELDEGQQEPSPAAVAALSGERPMSWQERRKTEELAKVSKAWTLPAVLRNYESGKKGEEAFAEEASIWAAHGYQPTMQSVDGGHFHAGRLLLTGGTSVLAGQKGIRSKGKLAVTFVKQAAVAAPAPATAQPDIADQIAKFAALRDQGILTEDEFQTKKHDLLNS